MQSLALALPSGWTMDALHKLVSFGYAPSTAVPHVAALVAGALAAAPRRPSAINSPASAL